MVSFYTAQNYSPNIRFVDVLAAPFRWAAWFFCAIADCNANLRTYDQLSRMSDAELAKRGLVRDELVHRVFIG